LPVKQTMREQWIAAAGVAAMAVVLIAATLGGAEVFGLRAEFILFGLTLLGVALLHARVFEVAVTGLAALLILKLLVDPSYALGTHFWHEAPILINLLGLLLGFALLSRHFEQSEIPELLPSLLPDGWLGAFSLLAIVFVLSAFLDNIAAAVIGATMALHLFRKRVHIGYLAAVVAASNAGGAGSVLGDTTTTMMWIDGVAWTDVLHAYVAALPALLVVGVFASRQQHRLQPIQAQPRGVHRLRRNHLVAVLTILVGAILANVLLDFPAAGVWAGIAIAAAFCRTDWYAARGALKGSLFLIALVATASLMPVEALPAASWKTTFGLGLASSVFDNIPLTKLALDQGGYDWGILAFAVGYGGSMIWFGSSAGVAVANLFPEAKSVGRWLVGGWHVTLAYVVGFFALLAALGWQPHPPHKDGEPPAASAPSEAGPREP
jgi:Na+/H+ antiporter NhaD/arsenite permease-like protein